VPTVTVSFTPLPAHVRTARFIAASVARRAGVAETILDEIRLAVSEACSLAVRLHIAHAPDVPVELRLSESEQEFSVQVLDAVVRPAPVDDLDATLDLTDDDLGESPNGRSGAAFGIALGADEGTSAGLQARERIGLAVISGLVDDYHVEYLDSGSVVTMTWPIVQEPPVSTRGSAPG
jgi:serine/threonine-protein kinase RsbW